MNKVRLHTHQNQNISNLRALSRNKNPIYLPENTKCEKEPYIAKFESAGNERITPRTKFHTKGFPFSGNREDMGNLHYGTTRTKRHQLRRKLHYSRKPWLRVVLIISLTNCHQLHKFRLVSFLGSLAIGSHTPSRMITNVNKYRTSGNVHVRNGSTVLKRSVGDLSSPSSP